MDEELLKILGKHKIPTKALKILWVLDDIPERGNSLKLINIYNYGVMQGKRAERARNKKRLQRLKSRQVEFYCKDNSFVKTKEEQNIG